MTRDGQRLPITRIEKHAPPIAFIIAVILTTTIILAVL